MSAITHLLDAAAAGDPKAAAELLPLVYDELRKLAAARLAGEAPGQTLTATALAHEAFLRLAGPGGDRTFAGPTYLLAAAADAVRHVLVDRARAKGRLR
ncbi:MAG: RNA polymerase subunit sigma, partial [Gemmataceae bacterium]|nr:RNA polymerase subunit sigma [Gemmataceae bacterium]